MCKHISTTLVLAVLSTCLIPLHTLQATPQRENRQHPLQHSAPNVHLRDLTSQDAEHTPASEVKPSTSEQQLARLVKDINNINTPPSKPSTPLVIDGTLFFSAENRVTGRELWRSDGTEEGTVLVRDIFPGSSGSGPESLTSVSGQLFFRATQPATGNELWRSDGSAEGAMLFQDVSPGGSGSLPLNLTVAGHKLFFTANEPTTGTELWVLDLNNTSR